MTVRYGGSGAAVYAKKPEVKNVDVEVETPAKEPVVETPVTEEEPKPEVKKQRRTPARKKAVQKKKEVNEDE